MRIFGFRPSIGIGFRAFHIMKILGTDANDAILETGYGRFTLFRMFIKETPLIIMWASFEGNVQHALNAAKLNGAENSPPAIYKRESEFQETYLPKT